MNTLLQQPKFTTTHSFTVFPDDLNYAGTLFGGKLLAEMDIAGAKLTRKLLYNSPCDGAVTVKVGKVIFKTPAHLGDLIDMEVVATRIGKSSIDMTIKVVKESIRGRVESICEADFTFVALKEGKPHPHYLKLIK